MFSFMINTVGIIHAPKQEKKRFRLLPGFNTLMAGQVTGKADQCDHRVASGSSHADCRPAHYPKCSSATDSTPEGKICEGFPHCSTTRYPTICSHHNLLWRQSNDLRKGCTEVKSVEGEVASPALFMHYWPTYRDMNNMQRWYFYWRTQARKGNYLPTDLSYTFVHVYEILNLVEMQT